MEDFYIGSASVKLFLSIFRMNFPEIVDIALPVGGAADVLDYATPEFAVGSKLGIDATRKLPGEGHHRGWPPLIKMDPAVRADVRKRFRQ